ncbi:MAG: major capsid protein [Lachnotalea sp.]
MSITLKEMREGMNDKVSQQVVDTFIRKSELLELLIFDNAVSPSGGSTLTYGYVQKKLPSTTAFRAINSEYTSSEATVEKKTTDLAVLGGAFAIDRVINQAAGIYDNMQLQIEEKIDSAIGTFHNGMINGDSSSIANSFDGLDKFLLGTTSEYGVDEVIDLSTMVQLKANADVFYEALLNLINKTGAHALLVNEGMKTKIQTVARVLGFKTESEESFGRTVTTIGEGKVRLIDLKNVISVSGENESRVAVETPIIKANNARTVNSTAYTGLTDIYAVRFSVLDGFLGVTLTGNTAINTYLPDFSQPGAVKTGEVEMIAAVALKNTKAAGVLRNIKIQ